MTYLYVKRISDIPEVYLTSNLDYHCSMYKNEHALRTSRYAYYLLSNVLKKMGFHPEEISFTETGKPYMKGIFFSLSHSKNLISFAVSDHSLGMDSEALISEKRFHLADKILSDKEKKEFDASLNKSLYLTEKWTLMEAMGKLQGFGIREELFKKNKEGYSMILDDSVLSVVPEDEIKLCILGDDYDGKSE